ncbi:MAG: hypothetical protein V1854_07620, partial [Methanobacteriota archaeon]
MPTPGEHKTVQARILAYAQEIGWTYVPRIEAEALRGFTPHPSPLPQGADFWTHMTAGVDIVIAYAIEYTPFWKSPLAPLCQKGGTYHPP